MKRFGMLAAVLGLALAPAANAATSISFTTNATTYVTGSTITLTVTGTSDGGETDDTLFGAIVYENTKVSNNVATNSQATLPGVGWVNGALTCTTVRCVAYSYINSVAPTAIGVTNATIATQTYTVLNVAANTTIKFSWQTTPTGSRLDWFGITSSSQSAPGGVTVTVVPIPEPTTAAMLGLGIFGLAVTGRRRA